MPLNNKEEALLAYWPFDEEAGSEAQDQVSGLKDSIEYIFNRPRYTAPADPQRREGISGNALLFDGHSTWIRRAVDRIGKPRRSFDDRRPGWLPVLLNMVRKTGFPRS